VLPNNIAATVTPSSLPAGIHGANHSGSDVPPLAGALEFGADRLAAAPTTVEVAAGYLAPRPSAVGLCSNSAPTPSAGVADDVQTVDREAIDVVEGIASRSFWSVHWAVGCAVTCRWRILRLACAITTNT
jgi:hypothetical protein